MDGTRVALALGSGGARGYAHIGVIAELADRGYDIVGVAGSSMGALVGGLHAAGALDDYTAWVKTLNQSAVLRLLDPAWRGAGVLRAEKVLDIVRDLLGGAVIEELPIPFTSVSTDLITGKSLWLQRGPVDVAIRASIAIPGVIAPYVADGRVLADGGILDPLPVGPLASADADVTIAVSLSGAGPGGPRSQWGDAEPRAAAEWFNRVVRSTSALLETPTARTVLGRLGAADDSDEPADEPAGEPEGTEETAPRLTSFEVMNRAIDVMQAALARHNMAAYPPDILIDVPRTSSRSLDYHRAAELIDVGRALTAAALDTYQDGLRSDEFDSSGPVR